jgi:hypothetical protein
MGSLIKQYLIPVFIYPQIDHRALNLLRVDEEIMQDRFLNYFIMQLTVADAWEDLYTTFEDTEWIRHGFEDNYSYNDHLPTLDEEHFERVIEYVAMQYELFANNAKRSLRFLHELPDNYEIANFQLQQVDKYSLLLTLNISIERQLLLPFIPAREVPF